MKPCLLDGKLAASQKTSVWGGVVKPMPIELYMEHFPPNEEGIRLKSIWTRCQLCNPQYLMLIRRCHETNPSTNILQTPPSKPIRKINECIKLPKKYCSIKSPVENCYGARSFLPKEASVWGASFLPRVAAICHAEEPQIILPERRLKLGNPLTATT